MNLISDEALELRVDAKSAFTLERFSGLEEHWPTWSVRAEGHFGMLGWTAHMDEAAIQPVYFGLETLGPRPRRETCTTC